MAKLGAPPMYDTPEDLQEAINNYINDPKKVKTITGLCYDLGFCSRQSFYDYEEKKDFSYTIKRARLYIESEYEQSLKESGRAGDIFALKNFGWKDNKTIQGDKENPLELNINMSSLLDDDIKE